MRGLTLKEALINTVLAPIYQKKYRLIHQTLIQVYCIIYYICDKNINHKNTTQFNRIFNGFIAAASSKVTHSSVHNTTLFKPHFASPISKGNRHLYTRIVYSQF